MTPDAEFEEWWDGFMEVLGTECKLKTTHDIARTAAEWATERAAKIADKYAKANEMKFDAEVLRGLGCPDHLVSDDGYQPAHPMMNRTGASIAARIRGTQP